MYFGNLSRHALHACAVIAVAASLGGCSMMPDWLGGDSDTPAQTADTTPAPDQGTPGTQQTAANAPYPDLADTPDRPTAPSTSDEQKEVASSLGADRARQNYSADQLRAGTETAAAPPPAEAPQQDVADVDPGTARNAPPPPSNSQPASDSSAAPASSPPPAPSSDNSAAPAAAPTTSVAATPAPAMSGPPTGQPAVPAVPTSSVPGAQSIAMSDAQLGFQPSKAPPLDASVSQFVAQPIIARYRQTAAVGNASGMSTGPAVPSGPAAQPYRGPAVGGPEQMSGAVVANFDSLQGGGAPSSVYADASGMPASSVVMFPRDTTILSASAKEQVRAAAQAFNAQGGAGYIRVVGHASSRSSNMSVSRHLQWDFEHSQARANSVARALIAAGVPATRVLVSAVGDDGQSDADGSHRADIFIQS